MSVIKIKITDFRGVKPPRLLHYKPTNAHSSLELQ